MPNAVWKMRGRVEHQESVSIGQLQRPYCRPPCDPLNRPLSSPPPCVVESKCDPSPYQALINMLPCGKRCNDKLPFDDISSTPGWMDHGYIFRSGLSAWPPKQWASLRKGALTLCSLLVLALTLLAIYFRRMYTSW
jgi:hypothetical protein